MQKYGLLFVLSVIIFTGYFCSKGPSDSQILGDWGKYAQDGRCRSFVKFRAAEVVGRSVKENEAEVLIRVTGDWIGPTSHCGFGGCDPGFFAGPCAGFHLEKGQNQTVEKKAIYKKYDSNWRIEDPDGVRSFQ